MYDDCHLYPDTHTEADHDGPPICDLCDGPEDQDPTNGREYNWNGETGNHLSCEAATA